jgi:hypothetical protein
MKYGILALALCLLPSALFAQAFRWTTFTSTSNVVGLTQLNGSIWTATSGGLAGYDPSTAAFDIFTNTRGLGMNQCVAVSKDTRGFIWVGLGDGRITRVNPRTGAVRQIVDLENDVFEINDVLAVGDEMFVAANNGIYRFSYYAVVDNYRVFEAITLLGAFPPRTRVRVLAEANGYLYAGTGIGLARARLSEPNLSAPEAWQNLTVSNSGLPENSIGALQGYPDSDPTLLNIATAQFVASLRDTIWFSQSLAGQSGFVSFAPHDPLLAASVDQIMRRPDSNSPWHAVGQGLPFSQNLAGITSVDLLDQNNGVVVGLSDTPAGAGGLLFSPDPETVAWSVVARAAGIGGNYIRAVAVDPSGRLWAGGVGATGGAYVYDNSRWKNFDASHAYPQDFLRRGPSGFVFDDFGGVWAASVGGGVAWFHGDSLRAYSASYEDTSSLAIINGQEQSRLKGIETDSNYIETYVARNANGDVYVTVLESEWKPPFVRVPRSWIAQGNNPAPWEYYSAHLSGSDPAADFPPIGHVLVDPFQRVWMGAGRNGTRTYVFDDHGTPSDTSDDRWSAYRPTDLQDRTTCFEDIFKEVLTWDVDAQSYLWVGTTNGAYYTQGGIPQDLSQLRFICVYDLPVGRRVNAIHVDAQDNKWFGTDEGVAVMDKNFNWIHKFQTSTSVQYASDLISNNVLAITSNPSTGEVWIGTSDGLSRYASPYVSAGNGDLRKIVAYPNPFRADGSQHMCIDPERLGGKFDDLRIYTLSGGLVRKLSWSEMTSPRREGGCQGWDGRNEDRDLVAGGVYLLVASSNDGKSVTGKIAVLGR